MEPAGNEPLEESRWLDDRRVMETRQEIDRIEQLGKVSVKSVSLVCCHDLPPPRTYTHTLTHQPHFLCVPCTHAIQQVRRLLNAHVAAKIGRNLQAKVVNGPLGKDKDSSITSNSTEIHIRSPQTPTSPLSSQKPVSPSQSRTESDSAFSEEKGRDRSHLRMRERTKASKHRWFVGRRNLGDVESSFEKDQKKELEELESMQVVKKRLANRRKASHLANRMFNQRVDNRRTKTSILLTGCEPDQEEVMKAMRNMNRFVIEKFLQTQSQNRRVLERLNSRHVKAISDIEVTKAKARRLSDSSVHEVKVIEEEEKREKTEGRRGRKRSTISSFFSLATDKTETPPTEKSSKKLKSLLEKGVQAFRPKRASTSAAISKGAKHKKGWRNGRFLSRRRRRQLAKEERMAACYDDDEAVSKSSGTDEVDAASCISPPFYGGVTLDTLFEKSSPVPAKRSIESDGATSPLVSGRCLVQPHALTWVSPAPLSLWCLIIQCSPLDTSSHVYPANNA